MSDPEVEERNREIVIVLSSASANRSTGFECVLDVDDFGEVSGIEILSFRAQLSASLPESSGSGWPRWAIDDEIDASYLHVRDGRATHQEKTRGQAHIDDRDVVASIEVPRGSARIAG
jgi:uncharacterized protein YuzE